VLFRSLFRGYIFLGLIGTIGVLTAYFYVLHRGGWQWGNELDLSNPLARQAATATFLGIVVMQIGNVFACRTRTESVLKAGLWRNRLALWGIGAELLLSAWIIYTPLGNRIFNTAPIGADVWLLLLPFTLLLFGAEELRKFFRRRRNY